MLLLLPPYVVKNAESSQTSVSRVFYPSHDAVVYEGDPYRNFGSHGEIGINYRIGFRDRSFIMFNLNTIPPGSTIVSAVLNLYMYDVPNSSRTLACYEVAEEPWDESKITWRNQPEATVFVTSVITGTTPKKLSLNVKESLARFTWKDNENYVPNYGWMLRDGNEDIGQEDDPFWICSKEHPQLDKRPYLEVKYYPPRLELDLEDSIMEAGTWIKITVHRKTSKDELITRGALRVRFNSSSPSTSKRFSLTPGGSEINELIIPNEESSAEFYYYDEKAGTWEISVWTDEYVDYVKDVKKIRVKPGPLHSFGFEHISSPKMVAMPFSITIIAYDIYGNVKTDYNGQNTLSDTTGTVEPKTTGKFKDGKWTGNIVINRTGRNIKITTTGDSKIGESNLFDIVIGPPSRIRITPQEFTVALGVVYSHFNISLVDAGGFESKALTDVLITLSTSSPSGEFREHGTGRKITSIVIPSGESSVKVNYYDTANGTWVLTASAQGFENGEAKVSVKSDRVPPETEIKIGNPKHENPSGIYVSSLTPFSFLSRDDLSGIMEVRYKVDNGSWNSYYSEFYLNDYSEGSHVITYFGVDKAGNRETGRNITVILDKTPPRVEKASPKERLFSNSMMVNFIVKVSDPFSGMREVELFVDGFPQGLMNASRGQYFKTIRLSEGYHNWSIRVTDNVDNSLEQTYSFTLVIETNPPTITEVSQPSSPAFGESAIITCRAHDEGSGIKEVYLCYSTDKGSTWARILMMPQENAYSGSIPSQFPFTEIQYYIEAIDNAGNRCQTSVSTYMVGMPAWFYSIIAILITVGVYVFLWKRFFTKKKSTPEIPAA